MSISDGELRALQAIAAIMPDSTISLPKGTVIPGWFLSGLPAETVVQGVKRAGVGSAPGSAGSAGSAKPGSKNRDLMTEAPQSIADIGACLRTIPNTTRDWDFWNKVLFATWIAAQGMDYGLDVFQAWERQLPDSAFPNGRTSSSANDWQRQFSRPEADATGIRPLRALARDAVKDPEWQPQDRPDYGLEFRLPAVSWGQAALGTMTAQVGALGGGPGSGPGTGGAQGPNGATPPPGGFGGGAGGAGGGGMGGGAGGPPGGGGSFFSGAGPGSFGGPGVGGASIRIPKGVKLAPEQGQHFRYFVLDRTTKPDPRPWLYKTWLCRGEITVFPAPGAMGKTATAIAMCLALASGIELLGHYIHQKATPKRILYVSSEDSVEEIARRLEACRLQARDDILTKASLSGRGSGGSAGAAQASAGAGRTTSIADGMFGSRIIPPVTLGAAPILPPRGTAAGGPLGGPSPTPAVGAGTTIPAHVQAQLDAIDRGAESIRIVGAGNDGARSTLLTTSDGGGRAQANHKLLAEIGQDLCESQDLICQTLSDELPFDDRPFIRAAPNSSMVAPEAWVGRAVKPRSRSAVRRRRRA